MKLQPQASLKSLNSMGIEASAGLLLTIEAEKDLLSAPEFNPVRDVILGGGSNVVFATDVPGTVFLNRIGGIDMVEDQGAHAWIDVGAGVNWHQLVLWSLQQGLFGLENLSLIPGLAGAAPVQNIGAYGVEISSVLERVTAWDMVSRQMVGFDREDCHLRYRDSRFKSDQTDRYLITSLRLRLSRQFEPKLGYAGLKQLLSSQGITNPDARQVSDAVIRLRQSKLPDPAVEGNAGSFFKNPVVTELKAGQLKSQYPALPSWPTENSTSKLSAAWMIEACGLKGHREGEAGVSDKHSLVLVNHGKASGSDIMRLARLVKTRVFEQFGVELEQEPVLIEF